MKKVAILSVLIATYCLCFVGCGTKAMNSPEETMEAAVSPAASAAAEETGEKISVTPYNGRNKEKIIKHLAQYPANFEQLEKIDSCCISTMGYSLNVEKLEEFVDKARRGEKASVDIITFTVEGTATPEYIQYNGRDYLCFEDCSNPDMYSSEDSEEHIQKKYKYMYYFEMTDYKKELPDVDFTGVDEEFMLFVLSNKRFSDYQSYRKSDDTGYSVRISPFRTYEEYLSRINLDE